jgi:hypothetical protein
MNGVGGEMTEGEFVQSLSTGFGLERRASPRLWLGMHHIAAGFSLRDSRWVLSSMKIGDFWRFVRVASFHFQ